MTPANFLGAEAHLVSGAKAREWFGALSESSVRSDPLVLYAELDLYVCKKFKPALKLW